MKILIAEDDPFFRRLLQKLLGADFDVITAEDGTGALAMIQEDDPPLLAVLDWVMPGMAGPQVCREVRSSPKTCKTYLILLTARNSSADILAGLRAGADDYITKPFEPEELRARMRIGRRVVDLQQQVATMQSELESTLIRERGLRDQLSTQRQVSPPLAKGATA